MDDLNARFVQGDTAAFEALFRAHQHEVYGWIVRVVHDGIAAEDLTIETFWRAYRSRNRFDPARSFGAWLRRIATNAAIDHLKRTDRRSESPADAADPASVARIEASDARRSIERAFRALPPVLRVTATLALVEERPYHEIAEMLDVSIAAVKSRVFRATRQLRQELTRLGWQR
jgi:RNA polymerase sigma-70 factor (ECF subfamily)